MQLLTFLRKQAAIVCLFSLFYFSKKDFERVKKSRKAILYFKNQLKKILNIKKKKKITILIKLFEKDKQRKFNIYNQLKNINIIIIVK